MNLKIKEKQRAIKALIAETREKKTNKGKGRTSSSMESVIVTKVAVQEWISSFELKGSVLEVSNRATPKVEEKAVDLMR